jgi:hypothetical protein
MLYLSVIVSAVATVVVSWRPRASRLGESVAAAAVGLATVYLLGGVYTGAWHTDSTAILFWCVLGMAARWGQLVFAEQQARAGGAPSAEPGPALPNDPGRAEPPLEPTA